MSRRLLLVVLPALVLLSGILPASPGAAQTIRSVSDQNLVIEPGGDPLVLRIDGTDLSGFTEARFLKDGKDVEGIRGELQTTDRLLTLSITADRRVSPLEGIVIELGGPRVSEPMRLPGKVLVAGDATGKDPAGDSDDKPREGGDPADDSQIQLASIDVDHWAVYKGQRVEGTVSLTAAPSQPIDVEIRSSRPSSVGAPEVVTVPAGQTSVDFELHGLDVVEGTAGIYLNSEIQARKVPFSTGPTVDLTTVPLPVVTSLRLAGSTGGVTPVPSTTVLSLRIGLRERPRAGGTIQIATTGPLLTSSAVPLDASSQDAFVEVPVNVGLVEDLTPATITATLYGSTYTGTWSLGPDQVWVTQASGRRTSVTGGDVIRLGVVLSRNAPIGGFPVPVQVSDPELLDPSPLLIEQADTGEVRINTRAVATTRTATVTIGDFDPRTINVTVRAPELASADVSGPVWPDVAATMTVSLDGPAPSGGLSIPLRTDRADLFTVPSTVEIAPGALSGAFEVALADGAVLESTSDTGRIQADFASGGVGVDVTARRYGRLAGVVISGVAGSDPQPVAEAWLDAEAPPGGIEVAISTDAPDHLWADAPGTIAPGETQVAISLAFARPDTRTTVTVLAQTREDERSTTTSLMGLPSISALSGPVQHQGAGDLTYQISISDWSAGSTLNVALSADDPSVQLPPSLAITDPGETEFTVTVPEVEAERTVRISATAGTTTHTRDLGLEPPARLAGLGIAPATLDEGATGTVTVNLDRTTTTSAVISLESNRPGQVTLPSQVSIPAGQSSVEASVQVASDLGPSGNSGFPLTVTATMDGVSETATARVQDLISGLNFEASAPTVATGSVLTLTVTVSQTRDAPSAPVTLTSSHPSILSVPATVDPTSGVATVQVIANPVPGPTPVTLTATIEEHAATVVVTVEQAGATPRAPS
ncbi:MAG: hypothetical protein HKN71_08110 [Gemmatimonadetes bacterium]|nr:hypothetical protein [Gemmatimonadota bacterium]